MKQVWMHKQIGDAVGSCLIRADQKIVFESDGFVDDKSKVKPKRTRSPRKVKPNDKQDSGN